MKFADLFSGSKKPIVVLGVAIIVVTNLAALGGVAYNRTGQPGTIVELSERELGIPFRYGISRENTGLQLRIKCRVADGHLEYGYGYGGCGGAPAWLDQAKLSTLGFRLPSPPDPSAHPWRVRNPLPREVYVVVEFNGDAYRNAVAEAQRNLMEKRTQLANDPGNEQYATAVDQAQKRLDAEQQETSRLFLIDAGRDKSTLRARYKDSSRYIVTRALVRPFLRSAEQETQWNGSITSLLVDSINLPYDYRELFEHLDESRSHAGQGDTGPRYLVEVAFGRRAEPWVVAARKL